MTSLVRSEFIKLLSTRTFYGLMAGAVAVVLLGTVSTIVSADPESLHGPVHKETFYVLASINAGLFALVLGIRSFTDEFRHGTIVTTLLAGGSRIRVLAAKVTVAAMAAAVMALVTGAVMTGTALVLSSARGVGFDVSPSDVSGLIGLVAALALWAAIGAALGAVVRHQVAAIVGGLIWVLIVENLGSSLLADAGRFLPGQAAHALADAPVDSLAMPVAAVVFVVYATVAALTAAASLVRRDVT
jgi:ABC-2 type transport system permease protein